MRHVQLTKNGGEIARNLVAGARPHEKRHVAKILVIGSVAWDEAIRLDAPLRTGGHNGGRWRGRRIGGGAANTGMALARAGDRPLLVSAVGSDLDGERLGNDLARVGLDLTWLDRTAEQTTRSLVLLDRSGERTIVNLSRAPVPLPPDLAQTPADCLLCAQR